MEKIRPPKVNERELKNVRIVLDTQYNQVIIECLIFLKDENGMILSVTPFITRLRGEYIKNGKRYSHFDRAYNWIFPNKHDPIKNVRTFIHDRARGLIKEHIEQVEQLESGTLAPDIPDPEPLGPVPEEIPAGESENPAVNKPVVMAGEGLPDGADPI